MVRRADELFLAIAVKNELISKRSAHTVMGELKAFEAQGQARKARHVCLEKGLLTNQLAKQIKRMVMEQLTVEKAAKASTRQSIAGFSLGRQLRAGQTGVLYEAQSKAKQPLSLQTLNEKIFPDGKSLKNYLKSLKAAMKVRHMNLVPVLDRGEDKGVPYVVMEAVRGHTLKQLGRGGRKLSEQQATRMLMAFSEALTQGINAGVLHGDIRPDNVFCDEAGFRLSHLGVMPSGVVTRSLDESAFRSPEQLSGEPIDLRSDMYSLGATVYFGLTGRRPFESLDAIRFDPLPPLTDQCQCSAGLARLVEAMMARKPEERYQSYEALVNDLDNVIAGFSPSLTLGQFVPLPGGVSSSSLSAVSSSRGLVAKKANKYKKGSRKRGRKDDWQDDWEDEESNNSRSATRRRRGRENDKEGGISLLPVAALSSAALIFILALIFVGGSKPEITEPLDDSNTSSEDSDKNTARKALELAAASELADAKRLRGWTRLETLENIARDYARTKSGKEAKTLAGPLRVDLEAQERKYYNQSKLKVDGLKAQGDWYKAEVELAKIVKNIRGDKLAKSSQKELDETRSQRTEFVKKSNFDCQRLTQAKRFQEAVTTLSESLGYRDDDDRAKVRKQIQSLEGKVLDAANALMAKVLKREKQSTLEYEEKVRGYAKRGQFKPMLKDGQALLGQFRADQKAAKGLENGEFFSRVELHVKASQQLIEFRDYVSAAALELEGEEIAIELIKGNSVSGRIKEIEKDGRIILKIPKGSVSVARDNMALSSQEELLKKAFKKDKRVPLLVGLRMVYASKVRKGLRRIRKAYDDGYADARYFLERKTDLTRLFESDDEVPEVVAKPKKPDKKPKKPEKKDKKDKKDDPVDIDPQELNQLVYDNRNKFFPSAREVGFGNGRTDALYSFYSGTKKLLKSDWRVLGNKVYASPDRQGVVLEKSGSVFHNTLHHSEVIFRVRFSYTSSLVRNSKLSLIIIDQKKKEEFHAVFGQQLLHYRKGRLAAKEGLQRFNQELLAPRTQHDMEIGYKDGEVWTKLNGQQHAIIKGLGIKKALIGLKWSRVSVNLHTSRIEGFLQPRYVVDFLEAEKKRNSKKKKRRK